MRVTGGTATLLDLRRKAVLRPLPSSIEGNYYPCSVGVMPEPANGGKQDMI